MKFYGELLILFLLLITNLRVLFLRHAKKDSLVTLAPLSFLLSILGIISWGLDIFTGLIFILSIIVLLSNFHALFRLSEKLYIDHYSPLMKVWSAITIILSIVCISFIIYFAPVEYTSRTLSKMNVQEKIVRYNGSVRAGFEESSVLKRSNLFLHEFFVSTNDESLINSDIEKKDDEEQTVQVIDNTKPLILLIPDKRADTYYYSPYLQELANEGYKICSADIYSSDLKWFHSICDYRYLRRFFMVSSYMINSQKFNQQKEFYTYNISQELKVLKQIILSRYGEDTKVFIITDSMGVDAVNDFILSNEDFVCGNFDLQTIEEYKTPGFGCIMQNDIFLTKWMNLQKDEEGFYTKYMVLKTKQQIENITKNQNTETVVE